MGFVDLAGFDGTEVGFDRLDALWLRGGFPESFLSASDEASLHWRQQFIRTFLTRDIPQLGITIPSEQLYRFWLMVAHYHGQAWNASEIAGSLGVNYKTAQHYLDILVGSFMIRSLPTWTENVGKRVRKAPKIYLRDSGLFHALQRIPSLSDLQAHPKIGASWEGLALEHVLRVLRAEPGEAFHWGTHGGAELDLLLVRGGRRWGFEFKYADAPRTTKSMRVALDDLKLERLFVVYPGEKDYALDDRIHVIGLQSVERLGDATGGSEGHFAHEKKLYLWDWSAVADPGARFENLVACQLLNYCHWVEDTEGFRMELRYLRDTDRREVDFVVLRGGRPQFAVECKTGERVISPSVRYCAERTPIPRFFQVHRGERHYASGKVTVLPFVEFCRELDMP